MPDKKSFILYLDRKKEISLLSNEQCGILFKAIFEYADTGNIPEIEDLAVKIMLSFIITQIDENAKKWEESKARRSEAGKKGGAPKGNKNASKNQKQAKTNKDNQKQAKQAVTDTDTVTDTVTDIIINNNISSVSSKQKKPPAKQYGEYKHILLTDSQYEELVSDYGERIIKEYISKIDEWIQLKGKSPYKDFNLAIRNWIKKDGITGMEDINEKYAGTAAMQGII